MPKGSKIKEIQKKLGNLPMFPPGGPPPSPPKTPSPPPYVPVGYSSLLKGKPPGPKGKRLPSKYQKKVKAPPSEVFEGFGEEVIPPVFPKLPGPSGQRPRTQRRGRISPSLEAVTKVLGPDSPGVSTVIAETGGDISPLFPPTSPVSIEEMFAEKPVSPGAPISPLFSPEIFSPQPKKPSPNLAGLLEVIAEKSPELAKIVSPSPSPPPLLPGALGQEKIQMPGIGGPAGRKGIGFKTTYPGGVKESPFEVLEELTSPMTKSPFPGLSETLTSQWYPSWVKRGEGIAHGNVKKIVEEGSYDLIPGFADILEETHGPGASTEFLQAVSNLLPEGLNINDFIAQMKNPPISIPSFSDEFLRNIAQQNQSEIDAFLQELDDSPLSDEAKKNVIDKLKDFGAAPSPAVSPDIPSTAAPTVSTVGSPSGPLSPTGQAITKPASAPPVMSTKQPQLDDLLSSPSPEKMQEFGVPSGYQPSPFKGAEDQLKKINEMLGFDYGPSILGQEADSPELGGTPEGVPYIPELHKLPTTSRKLQVKAAQFGLNVKGKTNKEIKKMIADAIAKGKKPKVISHFEKPPKGFKKPDEEPPKGFKKPDEEPPKGTEYVAEPTAPPITPSDAEEGEGFPIPGGTATGSYEFSKAMGGLGAPPVMSTTGGGTMPSTGSGPFSWVPQALRPFFTPTAIQDLGSKFSNWLGISGAPGKSKADLFKDPAFQKQASDMGLTLDELYEMGQSYQDQGESGMIEFLAGKAAGSTRIPIYTTKQQKLMKRLGELGERRLDERPSLDFGPIEEAARAKFREETIPGLAERFTAGGGRKGSSAFRQQLGKAGAGLERSLAELKSQYGLQRAKAEDPFTQALIQAGLTSPYQIQQTGGQKGFAQTLAPYLAALAL